MSKDASLFSSLSEAKEENIFVVDDHALTVVGSGRVDCGNGVVIDFYHVPNISETPLYLP
jgi:hypothetical protein